MVAGEQKNEVAYFLPSMKAFGIHVMVHMIALDEEYLEKGLIRTCIRTGVQQIREKKNVPGRGILRRFA